MGNQNQETSGMDVSIHTISTPVEVPVCTSIKDIKSATKEDGELQMLKRYIIGRWPDSRETVKTGAEKYWLIKQEFVMINGVAMKGKQIIIPCMLHR